MQVDVNMCPEIVLDIGLMDVSVQRGHEYHVFEFSFRALQAHGKRYLNDFSEGRRCN